MRSKYEIKCQKQLEADGYTVDYKVRPSRFFKGQPVDYFHLWDLIAVKRGENLRFISVKGHAGASKKHQQDVADFWLPPSCSKEIWSWGRNKKWRKLSF